MDGGSNSSRNIIIYTPKKEEVMPMVKFQGRDIEVEEVDVVMDTERWNEYQLADGVVLSVKLVLLKVCKVVNEKTPDGTDLYLINSQNIVKVKTIKG